MRAIWTALLLAAACSEVDPLNQSPDSGARPDSSLDATPLDAGGIDASASDAMELDASEDAGEAPDAGGEDAAPCLLDQPGPADRDRVVLVGQPFTAVPGVDGTEIRSLLLSSAGALTDVG